MSDYTPEQLQNIARKHLEQQKRRSEQRKKTHEKLGVEVSRLAAHALRVLAEEKGLSMSKVLTRMLEHEAKQRGIVLPVPVSQVVTEETPKVNLQDTLNIWGDE